MKSIVIIMIFFGVCSFCGCDMKERSEENINTYIMNNYTNTSNREVDDTGHHVNMIGCALGLGDNNLTEDEIAHTITEEFLKLCMEGDVSDYQRITDYKIKDIHIEEENESFFEFRIIYSIKGATDKIAVIDSGKLGKDSWIDDICNYIIIKKETDKYTIVFVGTDFKPLKKAP